MVMGYADEDKYQPVVKPIMKKVRSLFAVSPLTLTRTVLMIFMPVLPLPGPHSYPRSRPGIS